MFKKTERKIVAAIMTSLVLFLITTLVVIYTSSYYGIKKENSDLLMRHVERFSLDGKGEDEVVPKKMTGDTVHEENGEPPEKPPFDDGDGPRPEAPEYELSTFYTVAFSKEGEVIKVDLGDRDIKSEEELIETAEKVLKKEKKSGKADGLMYMVDEREEYTLVAFMDSTVTDNSMKTLLKNTLFAGAAAIVLMFAISVFIAKKIVKPLEENDRRQRQFVSDAGHELKTPVSVISTNTELLSRRIGDNEWLSNIQYENERMGSLVTELLDLSHAEGARVQKEHIDLSRLVTGEALPFESVAFEKGQTLSADIEENITVEGSRTQLSQLTSILLDNAVRHGKEGKEIFLSLKKDRKFAVLTVENHADEIPKEKLEHLFERFYRVDEARNGEDRHYGLGLAIAKAITEAHKGVITASYGAGKIKFTVQIPTVR